MPPGQVPAPKIEPYVWRVVIVIVLGAIMSVLDTTIVNVALDTLSADLDASLDEIQWVATGYLLSLAAVIPVSGWAARRYGARKMYLISLVVFTAGSALCGLATSSTELIAFRVIQGVGGGMLTPVGQMILVTAAGRAALPRVMSAVGVPVVLAPIFGPTVGGLLLEHVSWQSIFLINVPIGVLTLVAALRLLPKDSPGDAGRLDVLGFVLVAAGITGITYGLAESGAAGSLVAGEVLVPFLGSAVLVAAFALRALRISYPLLDLRLWANRAFAAACLTTFFLGAALFGGQIILPLYFQLVRGEDAVVTGLLLIPQGVGAMVAMYASGRMTERFGGGVTSIAGCLVSIVATIPFLLITGHTSYVLLSIAMVIRGFGLGLSIMPAMTAAFTVLRPEQINDASPQLNTLQRVGGSIGVAILTVTLQSHLDDLGPRPSADALAGPFNTTFAWVIGITVVALVPTIVLTIIERRRPSTTMAVELVAETL